MKERRALILMSGGQDSTTCLFWAIKKYGRENTAAIGFQYGQRHGAELEAAGDICRSEHISYYIMDLSLLGQITANALTRRDIPIDSAEHADDCSVSSTAPYPNTFVDGRNHLFISFAAIYAKQQGIHDIVTGVSQTDFSGYPDCRDVFIKSLNVTLTLAMDFDFNIITPLMWKNKSEIWALADELGCLDTIRDKTLTCYEGVPGHGCGKCPACMLRRRGYDDFLERKRSNG